MDPKPATCTKDHCTAVDPSWCHTCVHNRRPARMKHTHNTIQDIRESVARALYDVVPEHTDDPYEQDAAALLDTLLDTIDHWTLEHYCMQAGSINQSVPYLERGVS